MTDLEKKIEAARQRVSHMMDSPSWQRCIQESDKQVEETLARLKKESRVDPKLLDEPAAL
ncbi:MAG: hypothetical protein ABIE70_01875 [bacterium]